MGQRKSLVPSDTGEHRHTGKLQLQTYLAILNTFIHIPYVKESSQPVDFD